MQSQHQPPSFERHASPSDVTEAIEARLTTVHTGVSNAMRGLWAQYGAAVQPQLPEQSHSEQNVQPTVDYHQNPLLAAVQPEQSSQSPADPENLLAADDVRSIIDQIHAEIQGERDAA